MSQVEWDIGFSSGTNKWCGIPVEMIHHANRKVFIWEQTELWLPVALDILSPVADSNFLQSLKQNRPLMVSSGWLDDAVEAATGGRPNTKGLLAEGLQKKFDFIRGYHGCRPESPTPYQKKGILLSEPAQLLVIARQIFSEYSRLEEAIAVANQGSLGTYQDLNRGSIFFCLTREELVSDSAHYVLYGSEYLQAIASELGAMHILRERGTPVIFHCDIPVEQVEGYLTELASEILDHLEAILFGGEVSCAGRPFAFHITVPLPATNIVYAESPISALDPLTGGLRET